MGEAWKTWNGPSIINLISVSPFLCGPTFDSLMSIKESVCRVVLREGKKLVSQLWQQKQKQRQRQTKFVAEDHPRELKHARNHPLDKNRCME